MVHHRVSTRRLLCAAAGPVLFAAGCSQAPPPPPPPAVGITVESRPAITPALADDKERENLSGAACSPAGLCLLIGDEKRYARRFTLTDAALAPGETVDLLPPGPKAESDGEGVAFNDGAFYVVGSHSRNKEGAAQPSRHFLFRVRIGADGKAAVDSTSLDPIIAKDPFLRDHLADAPGEGKHGVNIEGIAVGPQMSFIGFRGPVDREGALIISVPTASLFGAAVKPNRFRLLFGEGQGVRDLAAVSTGVLVLTGPEMRKPPAKPELFFWNPGGQPVLLGALPAPRNPAEDSPESITVLSETDDAWRVLMLSDGKAGGEPVILKVAKPR